MATRNPALAGRPQYSNASRTPSHLSGGRDAPVSGVARNANWGLTGTGRDRGMQNAIAADFPTSTYADNIRAYNAHDQASAGSSDLSAAELAQMALNATNSSGGGGGGGRRSGGGGRGGGGGVAAPSAEVQAAYAALLENFTGDAPDPWADYDEAMKGVYSPDKVNKQWDTTLGATTDASKAGRARLAGIMRELSSRAAQSRQDVSQAVSRGGDALTGLENRYMQQANLANQGLNQGLGAFGAGTVAPTGLDSLRNLFAAGQMQNQVMGNSYETMAGDRDAIYAGLDSDVAQGMTRDQAALQAAIAARRQQALQANSSALAQALGQSGVQRAQSAIDRQLQADKLRLEMAQMGIKV